MTEGTKPLPELPHQPWETELAAHGNCQSAVPYGIQTTGEGTVGRCSGGCSRPTIWIAGFHGPNGYRQGYWMLRSQITER